MTARVLQDERVLLVGEYIAHGGTRTYFKSLLEFYARHGAEVIAITSFDENDPDMRGYVKGLGLDMMTYPMFAAQVGLSLRTTRPAVWSPKGFSREREAFLRFTSLHGISRVTLSVGTSGLFLSAAGTGLPTLMVAHGYPHGWRQRLLGQAVMAPRVPATMSLVTVSDFSGRLFRSAWNLTGAGTRIRTVYSTCGPPVPSPSVVQRRPLVFGAALVESHKRPVDWIRVAERVLHMPAMEQVEFLWVGDGPCLEEARSAVDRSVTARVQFPGWSDDLAPFYREARVYLQLSDTEALGLSVVDALRHGLPCVVSDAGGLPEVVRDGVNGFVVPVGDVAAAARAVERLLKDDQLWAAQSIACQNAYRNHFAPEIWDSGLLKAHGLG